MFLFFVLCGFGAVLGASKDEKRLADNFLGVVPHPVKTYFTPEQPKDGYKYKLVASYPLPKTTLDKLKEYQYYLLTKQGNENGAVKVPVIRYPLEQPPYVQKQGIAYIEQPGLYPLPSPQQATTISNPGYAYLQQPQQAYAVQNGLTQSQQPSLIPKPNGGNYFQQPGQSFVSQTQYFPKQGFPYLHDAPQPVLTYLHQPGLAYPYYYSPMSVMPFDDMLYQPMSYIVPQTKVPQVNEDYPRIDEKRQTPSEVPKSHQSLQNRFYAPPQGQLYPGPQAVAYVLQPAKPNLSASNIRSSYK